MAEQNLIERDGSPTEGGMGDEEQQYEERYAIAARAATDGLWDWDLKSNQVYFSPRWKAMLGFREDELSNSPNEWLDRVHSKDLGRLLGKLSDHLHRGADHFESEHRVAHRDGSYRWMRSRGIAVREESGEATRIIGWQTDITDRKRAEDRLKHEAWHDPLTDLPNRAYFRGQLQRMASRSCNQPARVFALLFVDLDDFKLINDTLGHSVGDQLLMALADRLRHSVRPGDTTARLGGDEFAILLKNIKDENEASQIAERIQREISQPFKLGGEEIRVNCSIGISLSSDCPDRPSELLRNADAAMYRAKARGRARYELFQPDPPTPAGETHYLQGALSRALEQGEFCLYYQPIISEASGEISGCEALIRWQEPDKGLILPEEFMPAAEETGFILPLGEWLLQTACAQARAWQEEGILSTCVSVNISDRQFREQDLFGLVSRLLKEYDLDPSLLQLELTENAVMTATAANIQQLERLSSLGVQICVDDFGMGYSSLIYLRRFPIQKLKIDGFFTREIATDPGDATMAAGVIALGHSLGLKVVAERVETPEQLEFLREEECDELQGDVICPPLNADSCLEFLRRRKGKSFPAARAAAHAS